jgi:glyoxylase-like metal-dependent hydrolase (beta-lactamase superfamily II)
LAIIFVSLKIQKIETGPLRENCWIVENEKNELVVIDPGSDLTKILRAIGKKKVSWILLTHTHYDHLGALSELAKKTGAPVAVHQSEAEIVEQGKCNPETHNLKLEAVEVARKLTDSDILNFGENKIQVLYTPGHTQGSCCFLIGDKLFSGDTIFYENYGRTDLPGGNSNEMKASLKKLLELPAETTIHPGHGPSWDIKSARKFHFAM